MAEEAKTFNGKGTYPFQVFTEITFTSVVEVVLREVYYYHNPTTCVPHKKFIVEYITLPY